MSKGNNVKSSIFNRKTRNVRTSKSNREFWSSFLFRLVRWSLFFTFMSMVLRGWYLSTNKYNQKKTAISLIKNETDRLLYPSITFCPKFKRFASLTHQIMLQQSQDSCLHRCDSEVYDWRMNCQCNVGCEEVQTCCEDFATLCQVQNKSIPSIEPDMTMSDIDMKGYIDKWSWKRQEILTVFSHPQWGDPTSATGMLYNGSLWTETIPHVDRSGKCYTYDPPFESKAGYWFGLRFGLKIADSAGLETENDKLRYLKESMSIFLHDKGRFLFYEQDDFPSMARLDMSLLKVDAETSISLEYKVLTSLSKEDRKCTEGSDYDYAKCVDSKFSDMRGCQAPWHNYNDTDIPICNNASLVQRMFSEHSGVEGAKDNYDRPHVSRLFLSQITGCPLPCTSKIIVPSYSYNIIGKWHWLKPMENGADWTVHLWFKNYLIAYETEYVICDWSCLIGEVGGNLGFFLGGSILAFTDSLLSFIKHRFTKW